MSEPNQEAQASVASGFLVELFKMQKISQEQMKNFQTKCQRLEDAIQKTQDNQRLLHYKSRNLKVRYETENANLQNLNQQEFQL